jgi:hypothetical protein
MAQNADDLETQLLAQAQVAIRAMLAKKKPTDEITLTEIERLVGTLGDELLAGVTQTLVNDAQQGQKPAVGCPECEEIMTYKGMKARQVVTVRGEVVVERAYYYCHRCRRGFFPSG